jgi:phosphate butyryltransferase
VRHLEDLDALMAEACRLGPVPVAVACGHDPAALEALSAAEKRGLARGILTGDPARIRDALGAMDDPPRDIEIVPAPDDAASAATAVGLVRAGRARILCKGKLQTATFLKAVLDRDKGLRTGRLLSNVFLFEYPGEEGKRLISITDGAINVSPDLAAKKQLLENAVAVLRLLGRERPRVAVLSAVENVIPGHGPSLDAEALAAMASRGEIAGCAVEGPLSLDLAIWPEASRRKGVAGEVAGRADVLLCPEIVSANLLAKSATYFGHFRMAHVVVGASAPVLTPSRSEEPEAKLLGIALGAVVAERSASGPGA